VAWDDDVIVDWIKEALKVRETVKQKAGDLVQGPLPGCSTWYSDNKDDILAKAKSDEVRITATEDEDTRSLKELLTIGTKGICSYADH